MTTVPRSVVNSARYFLPTSTSNDSATKLIHFNVQAYQRRTTYALVELVFNDLTSISSSQVEISAALEEVQTTTGSVSPEVMIGRLPRVSPNRELSSCPYSSLAGILNP